MENAIKFTMWVDKTTGKCIQAKISDSPRYYNADSYTGHLKNAEIALAMYGLTLADLYVRNFDGEEEE